MLHVHPLYPELSFESSMPEGWPFPPENIHLFMKRLRAGDAKIDISNIPLKYEKIIEDAVSFEYAYKLYLDIENRFLKKNRKHPFSNFYYVYGGLLGSGAGKSMLMYSVSGWHEKIFLPYFSFPTYIRGLTDVAV